MNLEKLLHSGYRYAFSLTHSREEAEDLVQEAWFKLNRQKRTAFNKSLFLLTIRHQFIDQYRRGKLIVFEAMENEPVTKENKFSYYENCNYEQLESSLAILRTEEREALFLNAVEGYSAREIANMTERPRNTVLSLIYRSKQKLIKSLKQSSLKYQANES